MDLRVKKAAAVAFFYFQEKNKKLLPNVYISRIYFEKDFHAILEKTVFYERMVKNEHFKDWSQGGGLGRG